MAERLQKGKKQVGRWVLPYCLTGAETTGWGLCEAMGRRRACFVPDQEAMGKVVGERAKGQERSAIQCLSWDNSWLPFHTLLSAALWERNGKC